MDTKPRETSALIFGRAASAVPGRNFNYNTEPAICQEENRKKIKNIFLPKPLTKLQECSIIKAQRKRGNHYEKVF